MVLYFGGAKRMRNAGWQFITVGLLAIICARAWAQADYEKINAHIGAIASVPLNPTAKYVGTGWGFLGGAGYNFSARHSVLGEFMWTRLYATPGALQPLRTASQSHVDGQSNLYVLTGNYRFEMRGRQFGTYFIGGGGLYYRITNLSARVTLNGGTVCTPTWVWWGFACAPGTLATNSQSVGSASSTAFGMNGGLGFTVRVGDSPYRFFVESRYHYAPNENISTQLATISFGIRF